MRERQRERVSPLQSEKANDVIPSQSLPLPHHLYSAASVHQKHLRAYTQASAESLLCAATLHTANKRGRVGCILDGVNGGFGVGVVLRGGHFLILSHRRRLITGQ